MNDSTAADRIRSALCRQAVLVMVSFRMHLTLPEQSWFMMDAGKTLFLPVTACRGLTPPWLESLFFAIQAATVAMRTSS